MTKPAQLNLAATPYGDEQQLIADLIAGDDRAFCEIIKRYQHIMLAVGRAIAGDIFADDIVQDAWLAVYKNIGKFEQRSSLKTWIMIIVSNEAKARLRRESRRVSLEELDGEVPGSYLDNAGFSSDGHRLAPTPFWHNESPQELLEEKQLQQCINKTLDTLPPTQKAAFILRDIEQESFDNISNILQVSAANVRVLVHRARLTLMQVIDRFQETGTC
ncbi:MAG TPA: RNA polymerase sigma factor [Cellvibrio sp.]|nr:RNA polymerase sigma factor [Cellvibrio sp.]